MAGGTARWSPAPIKKELIGICYNCGNKRNLAQKDRDRVKPLCYPCYDELINKIEFFGVPSTWDDNKHIGLMRSLYCYIKVNIVSPTGQPIAVPVKINK